MRTYEEAYADGFPISGIYLASGVMKQTNTTIVVIFLNGVTVKIKKIHLFCDIRVHEQVKRMSSIQYEIDSFQQTLDDLVKNSQPKKEEASVDVETIRSDVFVRSTIATQSEMIGKALLEVWVGLLVLMEVD